MTMLWHKSNLLSDPHPAPLLVSLFLVTTLQDKRGLRLWVTLPPLWGDGLRAPPPAFSWKEARTWANPESPPIHTGGPRAHGVAVPRGPASFREPKGSPGKGSLGREGG